MRSRFTFARILILGVFCMLITSPVFAQTQGEFQLGITRTFGYGNGSQIRGTFTLSISGSGSIQSVQYLIDGSPIGSVASSPFTLTFQTTDFPDGPHDISAIVTTTDGQTVNVPARTFEFATSQQESSGVLNIVIPILVIVLVIVLGGVALQVFVFKKKFVEMAPGTPRNYGFRGGTICPRCHRPYSLHFWAVRLVFVRFDRCDFCGKWAFVHPYSMNDLRAAEQNELAEAKAAPGAPAPQSEEDKLREMIDKSKYSDQ